MEYKQIHRQRTVFYRRSGLKKQFKSFAVFTLCRLWSNKNVGLLCKICGNMTQAVNEEKNTIRPALCKCPRHSENRVVPSVKL
jgi:hypothetical protein